MHDRTIFRDQDHVMPIEEDVVKRIAAAHHKTTGQILLKHASQRGLSVLLSGKTLTLVRAYAEV